MTTKDTYRTDGFREKCPICDDECILVWSSIHGEPTCYGCYNKTTPIETENANRCEDKE